MRQAKSLRLTPDEWDRVSKQAAEIGISPSEWIREVVLEAVKHPEDRLNFPRGMMEERLYKRVKMIHALLFQHYEDRNDVDFIERVREKAKKAL